MHKRRHLPGDFNPEKFLKAEAKQHEPSFDPGWFLGRRVVVLESRYKDELLQDFRRQHPTLIASLIDNEAFAEAAGQLEEFLRRDLSRRKIRVGEKMFKILTLNLLERWVERQERDDQNSEEPPAE